jgi:biotin carboxylase
MQTTKLHCALPEPPGLYIHAPGRAGSYGYIPEDRLIGIEGLKGRKVMRKPGNQTHGIDPGAGLMQAAEKAVEDYGLDCYRLISSSGAGKTTAMSRTLTRQQWIVAAGWSTHWMFSGRKLHYHEDPHGAMGGPERVHAPARKGFLPGISIGGQRVPQSYVYPRGRTGAADGRSDRDLLQGCRQPVYRAAPGQGELPAHSSAWYPRVTKNIFVVGLDAFNLAQLQALRHAGAYRFHSLIGYEEIKGGACFPVREFLSGAKHTLGKFQDRIDAIVGYWDFPVSTLLPVLRREQGLPGPTLEAALKCEHKFWSRQLQKEVVPALVPPFEELDPFRADAIERCSLHYPFWLKPVKAASSHLGFLIHNETGFRHSLSIIRERIARYAEPFNHIMAMADLPEEIAAIDGNHCIAEGIISAGRQCTLEGYVHAGKVHVYGIVDSIREGKHRSCFARYQYPSSLPRRVQSRMIAATETVLTHMGYDDSPFNAEFYWHAGSDAIRLLEINTRISKSHCPLFKLVDGEYHHAVMIEVALGQQPDFPFREGRFRTAAKFMLRCYCDGTIHAVPDTEDIERVKQRFPGAEVLLHVEPGMRLSSLPDQDSYSYEIAVIFLGADNQKELLENYRTVRDMLPFKIEYDDQADLCT